MRMFKREYPASELVDAAIEVLHNQAAAAEIWRWRHYEDRIVEIGQRRVALDNEDYGVHLEQGMSLHRMRDAQLGSRVLDQMVQNQQVRRAGREIRHGRHS
jgi:hypothetical protein